MSNQLPLDRPGVLICCELDDNRGPLTALVSMIDVAAARLIDGATGQDLGTQVGVDLLATEPSGQTISADVGPLVCGMDLDTTMGRATIHGVAAHLEWRWERGYADVLVDLLPILGGEPLSAKVENPSLEWHTIRQGTVHLELLVPELRYHQPDAVTPLGRWP